MNRYYKVLRTSESGEKITELFNKRDAFEDKKNELCEKYGITEVVWYEHFLCAVVAVKFAQEPDMKTWKKHQGARCCYELRARPANEEVPKNFDELDSLAVSRNQLNMCVGINDKFHFIGISESVPDIYLIVVQEKNTKYLTADCIEISNIEYAKLTQTHE